MDPRIANAMDMLEATSDVRAEESQALIRTLATVLEARQADQEIRAMFRDQMSPHIEPWTFDVSVSEEDEHAIVSGLVDLAVRACEASSVIHAIRKASCPPLLYAAERLLESKSVFGEQEVELMVYLFSDLKVCYKDTVKVLLAGQAAKKILTQAMSSSNYAIRRDAAKIQEWSSI